MRSKQSEILGRLRTTPTQNWQQAYGIIKQFYTSAEFEIIKSKNHFLFSAYTTPFWHHMNVVEKMFYDEYVCVGSVPIYPLFPVGKYYIDFANPIEKFGIEVDGKQFHDPIKDFIRDSELNKMGWTIYRIPARNVHNEIELGEFIYNLRKIYYDKQETEFNYDDADINFSDQVDEAFREIEKAAYENMPARKSRMDD